MGSNVGHVALSGVSEEKQMNIAKSIILCCKLGFRVYGVFQISGIYCWEFHQ